MEAKPSAQGSTRTMRFLPAKDGQAATAVYCNNVQILMSNWDIRMNFGEIESVSEKEIVIQPKLSVIMSPQHAKALAAILSGNIKNYEKDFGEIRTEPIRPVVESGKK